MNKKELQKLKAEWNQKLKDSGFEDIEDSQERLHRWHNNDFRRIDLDFYNARKQYFEDAQEFLNWYEFNSPEDKIVWELHTAGLPIRQIAEKTNRSKSAIGRTIKRLRREQKCPN